MRRYSFIVVLHVLAIALLAVGVYLLAVRELWFSALMVFLVLVAVGFNLYRMQMVQIRMMRHLAESLRFDDMMLSFRSPYRNRSMEQMVDELCEAMRNFRTHVLEHNEMAAWQKLIRVLTHEIMNSLTPIISLSETLCEREVDERSYSLMYQGACPLPCVVRYYLLSCCWTCASSFLRTTSTSNSRPKTVLCR